MKSMVKQIKPFYRALRRFVRECILVQKRLRLKNRDFSLISNNCNGGILCHELKVRFNTPIVNLYMSANDFIQFLEKMPYYLEVDVTEYSSGRKYPEGKLGDLILEFVHYESFTAAKIKWDERKKRINWQNLFVMMTEQDGATEDTVKRFDALPYKNKVIFTQKKYDQYNSAFYIENRGNAGKVASLFEFLPYSAKRGYDAFDYIAWFNGSKVR